MVRLSKLLFDEASIAKYEVSFDKSRTIQVMAAKKMKFSWLPAIVLTLRAFCKFDGTEMMKAFKVFFAGEAKLAKSQDEADDGNSKRRKPVAERVAEWFARVLEVAVSQVTTFFD